MGACCDGARRAGSTLVALVLALGPGGGCGRIVDDDDTAADDDAGDDDDTSGDDDTEDGPCDRWNTLGVFTIETDDTDGRVRGYYYDGPNPWEMAEVVVAGPCAFYGFDHIPNCDPPCVDPEVCGWDDACHLFPEKVDAGTLTVAGLDEPLIIEPNQFFDYYSGAAVPEMYAAGTELSLSLAGSGSVDPFELTVEGVVGPMTPDYQTVVITPGEALTVSWTPAPVPADARMLLRFRIDHHALVGGYSLCDVPDADGQVTVPVEIVDALFATGSHVENGDLTRYTRDVVETNLGCAEWISFAEGFLHVD
jgi:hypothetical protein